MFDDPTFLEDIDTAHWSRPPVCERVLNTLTGSRRLPVDRLLRDIFTGSDRYRALSTLQVQLCDQGLRSIEHCERQSIPFIGRLLTCCSEFPEIAEILMGVLIVLAVDQEDCCLGGSGIRWPKIWEEDCYNLVAAQAWRFLPFLAHESESLSMQACRGLGWFPATEAHSIPKLDELACLGRANERVSAILALGLLGKPIQPLSSETRLVRFASTVSYCHIFGGRAQDLKVFLEMAELRTGELKEFKIEPFDFSLLEFAAEVLHRQPPKFLQEFLCNASDGALVARVELDQPWRT